MPDRGYTKNPTEDFSITLCSSVMGLPIIGGNPGNINFAVATSTSTTSTSTSTSPSTATSSVESSTAVDSGLQSLSLGAKVGIGIIVSIAILGVIGLAVLWLLRRRKRKAIPPPGPRFGFDLTQHPEAAASKTEEREKFVKEGFGAFAFVPLSTFKSSSDPQDKGAGAGTAVYELSPEPATRESFSSTTHLVELDSVSTIHDGASTLTYSPPLTISPYTSPRVS